MTMQRPTLTPLNPRTPRTLRWLAPCLALTSCSWSIFSDLEQDTPVRDADTNGPRTFMLAMPLPDDNSVGARFVTAELGAAAKPLEIVTASTSGGLSPRPIQETVRDAIVGHIASVAILDSANLLVADDDGTVWNLAIEGDFQITTFQSDAGSNLGVGGSDGTGFITNGAQVSVIDGGKDTLACSNTGVSPSTAPATATGGILGETLFLAAYPEGLVGATAAGACAAISTNELPKGTVRQLAIRETQLLAVVGDDMAQVCDLSATGGSEMGGEESESESESESEAESEVPDTFVDVAITGCVALPSGDSVAFANLLPDDDVEIVVGDSSSGEIHIMSVDDDGGVTEDGVASDPGGSNGDELGLATAGISFRGAPADREELAAAGNGVLVLFLRTGLAGDCDPRDGAAVPCD